MSGLFTLERRIYGDAVADEMARLAIFEQITACGEVLHDDPGSAVEGIFAAARFMDGLAQVTGG